MDVRDLREPVLVGIVAIAVFVLAIALSPLGEPWSWALLAALLGAAAARLVAGGLHELNATRAQLTRQMVTLAAVQERLESEHATTGELANEAEGLRDRLLSVERVAGEARERLQRYDLIQRPGGFEIELLCTECNAWRPSGVITTWEHFRRDDPFVIGGGRFILSCGHEVRVDNYVARPGAKSTRRSAGAISIETLDDVVVDRAERPAAVPLEARRLLS